jgi:hypothetical protein
MEMLEPPFPQKTISFKEQDQERDDSEQGLGQMKTFQGWRIKARYFTI